MQFKEKQARLSPNKRLNNFMGSLPEANQIFDTGQHLKRNIYPFEMKTRANLAQDELASPYHKATDFKFVPPRETVMKHFLPNDLVYDKFNNNADQHLFNLNLYPMEKLRNLKNIDYVTSVEQTQPIVNLSSPYLTFDSRFESGNLSLASHVAGLYCLLLHNDVNTFGYTSWFYFQVKNRNKGRYKFAIMNYGKAGWMHNQGVKLSIYSKARGWTRGGENILCQRNQSIFGKGNLIHFNTLYFEYQFMQDDSEVYFSYNVPYTYNDLCCLLDEIDSPYLHRKLAGLSLAGNRLEMLTVTNFEKTKQGIELPVIIVMARAHSGETVSSWLMHEFLAFLLSNSEEAQLLLDNFIFKLFPMINPDGVIHGNYRCSLSGRDLNRRWQEPNKDLFPEIYFIKNQVMEISKKKQIKMILDFHGHSQKRRIFAYGCQDKNQPHRSRLFPYILSKLTHNFDFRSCNFYIDKSKYGTARVTLFHQLKIPYVYTIECSQFGTSGGHLNESTFKEMGESIAKGILILFKVRKNNKIVGPLNGLQKEEAEEEFDFEKELQNDHNLLKVGMERDDGSDSEPSADNIKFDRLAELNQRKNLRINSNIARPIRSRNTTSQSGNLQKHLDQSSRPKTGDPRRSRLNSSLDEDNYRLKMMNSQKRPMTKAESVTKEKCLVPRRKEKTVEIIRRPDVNLINFSVSIDEDHKKPRRIIPLNLRFENPDLYDKLKVISRFRVFK